MHISEKGLHLIKNFEGFRAHTYCCPSGQATIGYGHSGPKAFKGAIITEAQADAILREDVKRFEAVVLSAGYPLTQNQFDALVSFAFNVGVNGFKRSSIYGHLNHKAPELIPGSLSKWVTDGRGNRLAGLVKRRAAEIKLFNTEESE